MPLAGRQVRKLLFYLSFLILLPASSSAQGKALSTVFTAEADGRRRFNSGLNWEFEYAIPPPYEAWWKEIVACEGFNETAADLHRIRFFAINTRQFLPKGETGWSVGYAPDDAHIYMALPFMFFKWIVQHEMVHVLMRWHHEPPGHPEARFEICGLHTEYVPARDGPP